MESHNELTDLQFEEQFANCTIEPTLFTHEAHLRLAWMHIDRYGLAQAIKNIRAQLISFTEAVGEREKYNETVTVAAVKMVAHFKSKSQSANFQGFISEYPRLAHNFKELLGSHYATDVFGSERAKSVYMEPELLPFD